MVDDSATPPNLYELRLNAIRQDPTVVDLAESDPATSLFVEADLIYHDLSSGATAGPVADHLSGLGGERHSATAWTDRAPGSAGKRVSEYLEHLTDDLHLGLWDFGARRRRDPKEDVRGVATSVGAAYPGTAAVHHLPVYAKAPWSFGPFGAPAPWSFGADGAPGVSSPVASSAGGVVDIPAEDGRVRLAVLDTGLPAGFDTLHPRLHGVVACGADQEEPYDDDGELRLDSGHGLFILDVAYSLAPFLTPIFMRRPARDASNLTLGEHLVALDLWDVATKAMQTGSRLIVNMSFAAHMADDKPGLGLLRELEWLAGQGSDVLAVVAAGNAGDDRETFPAACKLPNVVSVGALEGNGQVASFSSRGSWVDCWTTGVAITGSYLSGVYDHPRGRRPVKFPASDPWAQWSGTSFAAPRVAAAIARKAAAMPGATLVAAWEALRKENRDCHPQWWDDRGQCFTETGVTINIEGAGGRQQTSNCGGGGPK